MKFIKTRDWQPVAAVLLSRIEQELTDDKRVLWLVSGGSNVAATVSVMHQLEPVLTSKLTIMLVDERYGKVDHIDSNDYKLTAAGLDIKRATRLQVLHDNTSFGVTREQYDEMARDAFASADIVIAQLGIGADGHIAGILPHSPATASPDFVAGYASREFQRLTLTHHALKRVAVAYVLAFGQDKLAPLEQLSQKMIPYADQPAQILKELPEAYIFSDQVVEAS